MSKLLWRQQKPGSKKGHQVEIKLNNNIIKIQKSFFLNPQGFLKFPGIFNELAFLHTGS